MSAFYQLEDHADYRLLRLVSQDGTNRLSSACVLALTDSLANLPQTNAALIITGNSKFFSAGADLGEIASLGGSQAYLFAAMGQALMNMIENFPSPVYAAIEGYCFGGGLDLALACHRRIASPEAIFGHRGAALGLITGWGGTQRLPRLIGKGRALQLLVAAEKVHANEALRIRLVDAISLNPVKLAIEQLRSGGYCQQ